MGITNNDIVEASIKILSRDGIAGLSMRSIAKELNIKAPSLYFHIKGKTELYDGIAEYMCVKCAKPDVSLEAKDYLTEAAKLYRAMLLSVKDSVRIFEDSSPNTPCRVGIIRDWVARISKIGVSEKNLLIVANLINNYVLSFTAYELRLKKRNTPKEIQAIHEMLSFSTMAPKCSKGTGARGSKSKFINKHDFDEQFTFGLRLIIAGIESAGGN
ncbi:MAG: TetR/AcrR family transcriptional regulator C-terminal domain-containing protein [Treponema sp.]|nr:TetR/AcrR family transcriptional regulator C-terminal domain-containing protein [Treponema sp.]